MRVRPGLKVISRYNELIVGIFAAKQYVTCFNGTTLHVYLNINQLDALNLHSIQSCLNLCTGRPPMGAMIPEAV